MADLLTHWRQAIYSAMDQPTGVMAHTRRIINDFGCAIPFEAMKNPGIDYTDFGYTKSKFTQLKRNYWNTPTALELVEKLKTRMDKPHSSVAMPLANMDKGDGRSQGHCMQSLVATWIGKEYHLDIYYRSTELQQKFLADLVFLSRMIQEDFSEIGQPKFVRFRFANAYVATVMLPILFRFDPDPPKLFKLLKVRDPKFYLCCLGEMRRLTNPNPDYTYRTRIKMIKYYQDHVDPTKMASLLPLIPKKITRDEDPSELYEDD